MSSVKFEQKYTNAQRESFRNRRTYFAVDVYSDIVFVFVKKLDRDAFVAEIPNKAKISHDKAKSNKCYVFCGPFEYRHETKDIYRPRDFVPYCGLLNNKSSEVIIPEKVARLMPYILRVA